MGPSNDLIRIPAGVYQSSTFIQPTSRDGDPNRTSQASCPPQRDRSTNRKGSSSSGVVPGRRFHIKFLPDSKEIRRVAAHPKPEAAKPVHSPATVQDGVTGSSGARTSHGLVGSHLGPQRCLSARPSAPLSQAVARFLHKQRVLPVSVPPIRPLNGASHIYESGQSRGGTSTTKGSLHICVPRRLATDSTIAKSTGPLHHRDTEPCTSPGLPGQQRKVQPSTISTSGLPRGNPGFSSRPCFPHAGKSRINSPVCVHSDVRFSSTSLYVASPLGPYGKHDGGGPSLPDAHEDRPTPRPVSFQPSTRPSVSQDSMPSQDKKGSRLVDSRLQSATRGNVYIDTVIVNPHDGRIKKRLGSAHGGDSPIRRMVSTSCQTSHQCPRVMGNPSSSPSTDQQSQGQAHPSTVRQYVGGISHKQAGRNPKPNSLSRVNQGAALVSSPPDLSLSSSPSRGGQRLGGRSLQEDIREAGPVKSPRIVGGMASKSDSLQDDLQQTRAPSCGPLRVQQQQSATNVLLMGAGPSSSSPRRDDDVMGQHLSVRISPHRSHPTSPSQDVHSQELQDDLNMSKLASPTVVPQDPDDASGNSDSAADTEGSDHNSRQLPSDGQPPGDQPDCLANFIESYRAAGLSDSAARLAGEARRPSTRQTYNTRLSKYREWCTDNEVDPLRASVGQVGDFLLSVFDQGAGARTVRNCRTAIGAVHLGFGGGITVSNSPALHDLIKGMLHKRPPERSLVPAWDLPTALQLLTEKPYEPMHQASLADITKKTAFLIAAASGRRVSDIHALSVADNHLVFSGGSVRLLPRSGYLAKNQSLDFTPSAINLPDLRKASGSRDEAPWCPVRALKFYLDRTKPYRGNHDQLFLTTQKPYRPASKISIARWIVDIIKESLSRAEGRLTGSRIGAHDLRSQAAAWASYRGASIQDIMDAMGWASSSTFQQVYLKDVLARKAGTGQRVLSSAAAAPASRPSASSLNN